MFHKAMRANEDIADFPDPVPFEDEEGNQHYKEGTDPEEKYLPSKLADVSKQPHKVPFSPTAQTAKNVGAIIKCADCKKPRLMFSQRMLKGEEKASLKRVLNGLEYVCGSSFQEFLVNSENRDVKILEKVFVKENLSCSLVVERPYYSCDFLKKVCIHCGSARDLTTSVEFYPKCPKCRNETNILKTKRKIVVAADLAPKNNNKKK